MPNPTIARVSNLLTQLIRQRESNAESEFFNFD